MAFNESLKKLIKQYEKQNEHPFLLVDLSGGKENTHTNILMSLLQFKNYILNSFLSEVLGLPTWNEVDLVTISTQQIAIGLKPDKKTNGYIDLYIKYKDSQGEEHIVVLENKINGATDTKKQMLRYIASVKNPTIDEIAFDGWAKGIINDESKREELKRECRNRHFVYLTLDTSKVPEKESLPPILYNENNPIIDYYPITYQDNILQWLKERVLRDCPYHDNGLVIAGLQQYIASLEGLLSKNVKVNDEVLEYVREFFKKGMISWATYKDLTDNHINPLVNDSRTTSDDNKRYTYRRLARELRKAAEIIVTEKCVPDGWVLHFTPTVMVLYKQEWMDIARGSYSIPFVNFGATPEDFLSIGSIQWQFQIEHFSPEEWKKIGSSKFTSTNHDRTAYYKLSDSFTIPSTDAEGRQKCILEFINKDKTQEIIKVIDNAVNFINSNKTLYSDDRAIRVELLKQLVNNQVFK